VTSRNKVYLTLGVIVAGLLGYFGYMKLTDGPTPGGKAVMGSPPPPPSKQGGPGVVQPVPPPVVPQASTLYPTQQLAQQQATVRQVMTGAVGGTYTPPGSKGVNPFLVANAYEFQYLQLRMLGRSASSAWSSVSTEAPATAQASYEKIFGSITAAGYDSLQLVAT